MQPMISPLTPNSPLLPPQAEGTSNAFSPPSPLVGLVPIRWLLALLLMLTFSGAAFAQDAAPTLTTGAALTFRASPEGNAYELGLIPAGTTVTASGRVPGWVQVTYNGTLGWVADLDLTWNGDPSALPNPFTGANDVPFTAYVTTQDNASFRVGPGPDFDRAAVLPPGTTLPAIGRTADGAWIQVIYGGQNGWVRDWLLVWTGDVVELELDGIDPVPFVRRTYAEAIITPETPVFSEVNLIEPDVIGLVSEPTRVELTGRLGSSAYRRLQFTYNGRYYWVLNQNVAVFGTTLKLLDLSANAPYGRLLGRVTSGLNFTRPTTNEIGAIWGRLARGETVSCENIPRRAREVTFARGDLSAEPTFVPAVRAVQAATENTNAAIDSFEALCSRSNDGRFATPEEIALALSQIETAERNLFLAETFFSPLAERDPAAGL